MWTLYRRDDPLLFESEHGWKGVSMTHIRWALTSQQCDFITFSFDYGLALPWHPVPTPWRVPSRAAVYEPLSWLFKGLQFTMFGLWPKGFVLTSLACHTLVLTQPHAREPAWEA